MTSEKTKEDELFDEAMQILAGYEEGLSARDFKSMADCTCGIEEHKHEKVTNKNH